MSGKEVRNRAEPVTLASQRRKGNLHHHTISPEMQRLSTNQEVGIVSFVSQVVQGLQMMISRLLHHFNRHMEDQLEVDLSSVTTLFYLS